MSETTAHTPATAPGPLDEYPIHQTPLPIARAASSDRNFYDRSYFNAHNRDGALMLVTGFGVYPNLGVVDACMAVEVVAVVEVSIRGAHVADGLGDLMYRVVVERGQCHRASPVATDAVVSVAVASDSQ